MRGGSRIDHVSTCQKANFDLVRNQDLGALS